METQEQPQYVNPSAENGVGMTETPVAEDLPQLPPATESTTTTQLQQISDQVAAFLARFPDYVGNFFNNYKSQITTVAIILAAIISVKLVLAVLDAVNDIPLFATIFELVGIGYATWFVSRYLLKASTRQELSSNINNFKNQILGKEV
ncbi:MAG: CAAD domain-containing protein [Calothrix sp. C42_A2020_038]|nr:CAAD domain-containing protein [Calothrix sp. C42_A2020_038]